MVVRVALDTNVLAYAEGVDHAPGDAAKVALSRALMAGFEQALEKPVLPIQSLAELHRLLIRLGRKSPGAASMAVREWQAGGETVFLGPDGLAAALTLAADHKLQIFDAMILASAVRAGCDLLVSEDMQDGFVWRGLTVTNLFGDKPHPRLRDFIANLP